MPQDAMIYLLLLLAVASGWLLGRFQGKRSATRKFGNVTLPSIDFLLAENNDKALERLLEVPELSDEAVELFLNLGIIFRDKGQVDKAIQLHQGLFARADLSEKFQVRIELELASDFLKAGLLDRAERLLVELISRSGQTRNKAAFLLVELYEEEKEWQAILDLHAQKKLPDSYEISARIAQSACELAKLLYQQRDYLESHKYLKLALKVNPLCARANVIFADIAMSQGEYNEAIRCFLKALKQDSNVMAVILDDLVICFRKLEDYSGLDKYLGQSWREVKNIRSLVAKSKALADQGDVKIAIEGLLEELYQHPSNKGFFALVELVVANKGELNKSQLLAVYDILRRIVESEPDYVCGSCGFKAQEHHWRCPSCKGWATLTNAS